jgi:hypothetical protein
MRKPNPESLKALKMWLDGKSGGPTGRSVATFQGLSAERLDHPNDLVALHPLFERDLLSKFVEIPFLRLLCLVSPPSSVLPLTHTYQDSHVDDSITIFSKGKMNRAASLLSVVIASILLIVSIVALYIVQNQKLRLGLICVFTVIFAASIDLLTNARRVEIFVSTAACVAKVSFEQYPLIRTNYAAVLVVFVSGNLGSSGTTASS